LLYYFKIMHVNIIENNQYLFLNLALKIKINYKTFELATFLYNSIKINFAYRSIYSLK